MKRENGITLIALVVTIIVLIILAGISLSLVLGENGLITKAREQQKVQNIVRIAEKLEIEKTSVATENLRGIVPIDEYIEYIKQKNIIVDDNIERVSEADIYITVEDKYVFLLEQEENNNLKITYQGEVTENIDKTRLNEATIEITGDTTQATLPVTLNAKVTHSEANRGIKIASCKYVLNTTSTEIGINESSYTDGTFSSNGQTIEINPNSVSDWYLHVLSVDNVGNKKETIKGPITLSNKYHTHTGSTTSGGACYTTVNYHKHTTGCYRGCGGKMIVSNVENNDNDGHSADGHYDWKLTCASCRSIGYRWSFNSSDINYNETCSNRILSCTKTTSTIDSYSLGCGKTESTLDGYTINY